MRRLMVLAVSLGAVLFPAAAGAASSCGLGRLTDGVPAACWRPFAADSFLNRPLGRVPVQGNSRALVRAMMSAGEGDVRSLFPQTRQGDDYYHPFVISRSDAPEYTIDCRRHCNADGRSVRIPCGARAASGSDAHLAVLDPRAGVEVSFFGVHTDLSRCRGGRLDAEVASTARLDGDGRDTCATAVCVGLTGGIIRFGELTRGRIDHALFMVTGACDAKPVFPASELSHCNGPRRGQPSMGQWFRLAMTPRQIGRLRVRPWQKTILRALARYGGFVGDQGSNGGFELQTESQETYRAVGRPNPWRAWAQDQARQGDKTIYLSDDQTTLMFGVGLPRAFWERHLRAVPACAVRRSC